MVEIKIFVSYSHEFDQEAAAQFRNFFADELNVYIDQSNREGIGGFSAPKIKDKLSRLIGDSAVTVVLVGGQTGGRSWIDWEIYYSLRNLNGKPRNGLLGVKIPKQEHWIPERLKDNIPTMGEIIDWPRDYGTLSHAIERVYRTSRNGIPNLAQPLMKRNLSRR